MSERPFKFNETAEKLARSPLGIIALFITLVYGIAAFVYSRDEHPETFDSHVTTLFMAVFPVLVLAAFTWLVSRHHSKLYAPADYKDEATWLKTLDLLGKAEQQVHGKVVDARHVQMAVRTLRVNRRADAGILWVDDHPENNVQLRRAFASQGIRVLLAKTTEVALAFLELNRVDVVITDMRRVEGPQAGLDLVRRMRDAGINVPVFIYTGGNPEYVREAMQAGVEEVTTSPSFLFTHVADALVSSPQHAWIGAE